jgi:hypothetical protein
LLPIPVGDCLPPYPAPFLSAWTSNFSDGISLGLGVGSSLEGFLSYMSFLFILYCWIGGKSLRAVIASIVASLIGLDLSNLDSLRVSKKWSLKGESEGGRIVATVKITSIAIFLVSWSLD